MSPTLVHQILELGAGVVLVAGALPLVYYYVTRKKADGSQFGLGLRAAQIILSITGGPIILILALEGLISHDAVGALLGTLLGFVLSPKDHD